MTEREFFTKLAKLRAEFYSTSSGQIRFNLIIEKRVYVIPPILVLANSIAKENKYIYSIDDWWPAANFLGLSRSSTIRITEAEDNSNDCDINVRKKLLKACKLKEKADIKDVINE